MPISDERTGAIATYQAELITIGNHTRLDLATGSSNWIAKPAGATHILLQALTQNFRYRIDGNEASATNGFRLAAGTRELIPVPNLGISLYEETAGAIAQYQWVR